VEKLARRLLQEKTEAIALKLKTGSVTMTFKMILSVLALSVVGMQAANAADYGETREQVVAINDAYIPSGFDSSSDAFAVVNGLFPNSCYRFRTAKVEHIGPALHEVRAYATVTEGLCLMVLVPYSKEVQLGKLAVGQHAIRFVSGDGTFWEKSLTIEN
jgi:hypothetical protein